MVKSVGDETLLWSVSVPWFVSGRILSQDAPLVKSGYTPPTLAGRGDEQLHDVEPGRYSGRARAGQPHGYGVAEWDSLRRYDGGWDKGREEGVGREVWLSTGSCYSGEFHSGLRSGYGVYMHCDGDMDASHQQALIDMGGSLGEFSWGKCRPFSAFWKAAKVGWVYAGQFKFGGRHGVGAEAMKDGSLYEGQFQDDLKNGFGVTITGGGRKALAQVWETGELRCQVTKSSIPQCLIKARI